MRVRYKQTECVCVVCGIPFIAFSARARTCTEVCRKRLSRQRRKAMAGQESLAPGAGLFVTAPPPHLPAGLMRPLHRPAPSSAPVSPIAQFLRLAAPAVCAVAQERRRRTELVLRDRVLHV
jgi:hypothetical protein